MRIDCLALAAGVTFYSLLALFPGMAAAVSSYGMIADASTIGRHLSLFTDIVPNSVLDLFGNEIARIVAKSDGRLTFGFLLGFVLALWSANAGMKAIFDALNIIYGEREKRGIIWLNVESLFYHVLRHYRRAGRDQHGGGISAGARRLRRHQL